MDGTKQRQILQKMGVDVYTLRQSQEPQTTDLDTPLSPGLVELESVVSICEKCELHQTRTQTVFGVGHPNAKLMFVGEAPGRDEDLQGQPFVGRAGQLLNLMLNALAWQRQDVYIANILKCRPPNNRNPQTQEITQCEPYLIRQIELIQPQLLVALGRFAAQSLLATSSSISRLRGHKHMYENANIPIVVTYHPAYLLRNPIDKRKAWEDLLFIKSLLI